MSTAYIACPVCAEWDRLTVALADCRRCGNSGYVEGTPEQSAADAVANAEVRADTSKRFDLGAGLWNAMGKVRS